LPAGHGLELGGEHAELFAQMFLDSDQLHRFAHKPTQQRAILVLVLDPLVDQILNLLGQFPQELHPLVLAEAALASQLLDPSTPPAGSQLA
jgi:hypothetical protein